MVLLRRDELLPGPVDGDPGDSRPSWRPEVLAIEEPRASWAGSSKGCLRSELVPNHEGVPWMRFCARRIICGDLFIAAPSFSCPAGRNGRLRLWSKDRSRINGSTVPR